MLLMVTNAESGDMSLVKVMNVEYTDGDASFIVFDYADNDGEVTCADAYAAERCIKALYNTGKANVEGVLEWSAE